MEMAAAYGVFASGGIYAQPMMILKVLDQQGEVLEEYTPQAYPVIDSKIAYLITDLLKSVMISPGTGAHLQAVVGREVAAKTGTTDDFHDAWMTGFTPELCCAVWVGYDQEEDVNLTGSAVAGPIWAQFLRDGLEGKPQQSFAVPEGITFTSICMSTGGVATESCPWTMQAAFIQGTEPQNLCWQHASHWDWIYQWKKGQSAPEEPAEPKQETPPEVTEEEPPEASMNEETVPEEGAEGSMEETLPKVLKVEEEPESAWPEDGETSLTNEE